ncbi:carboxypeptidase-like regulatory domain-containing protein [Terrimonas ferruginea]|uniref:carboxypeptidase-like regulatory domain-containing protein n=1 Tax=Terrimonas ferruginea TaxID=249 RepID=UPI0012DBFF86|nr:carboxypeptidase-like regulatory domain-containing protein [Terrimonas ferruginea]
MKTNTPEFSNTPPPIDIKGRIMNENGEPVVATVTVKGTANANSTNDAGYFELKNVDDNATLVITGVNIESYELKVQGRTEFGTVSVRTKVIAGETVTVNTGYQSLPKERSTGSGAFSVEI